MRKPRAPSGIKKPPFSLPPNVRKSSALRKAQSPIRARQARLEREKAARAERHKKAAVQPAAK
ncbi:hypothetical protein NLB25_27765, partial [Klebsiella pneumoniae]|nr:hypothetical protein [Klebsiella pneumoniae]